MLGASRIARPLADAFLADGSWDHVGLVERGEEALVGRKPWLVALATRILELYPRAPYDRPRELAEAVRVSLGASRATAPAERRRLVAVREMGRRRFAGVPELTTTGALAGWLGLQPAQLDWLADVRSLERTVADERLRNYRYGTIERRAGGPPRVLERPKARLKAAQRDVLHGILDAIAPHDAAHGFVRGRSARTHAAAHVGRCVVLAFDLEDFFASVAAGRVFGVLRMAGFPEAVAHALTGLTTNATPAGVWTAALRPEGVRALDAHARLGRRLATPHLPQGAPTSPALANLCAFALDRRLAGLARGAGATYTRYADDLVLSGGDELLRRHRAIRARVEAIVRAEGFAVNPAKSRLLTDAGRQTVAGIVVNARPNVTRAEFDELKAILHRAALDGAPASQYAHLAGRVAWVASLHADRGARLQARLDAITWH